MFAPLESYTGLSGCNTSNPSLMLSILTHFLIYYFLGG